MYQNQQFAAGQQIFIYSPLQKMRQAFAHTPPLQYLRRMQGEEK